MPCISAQVQFGLYVSLPGRTGRMSTLLLTDVTRCLFLNRHSGGDSVNFDKCDMDAIHPRSLNPGMNCWKMINIGQNILFLEFLSFYTYILLIFRLPVPVIFNPIIHHQLILETFIRCSTFQIIETLILYQQGK